MLINKRSKSFESTRDSSYCYIVFFSVTLLLPKNNDTIWTNFALKKITIITLVFLNKEMLKNHQKKPENWKRKSSYLLNNLRNFNEIFRKNVAYDDNKSRRKSGFTLFLEDTFLEKPKGFQIDSSSFLRVKWLNFILG